MERLKNITIIFLLAVGLLNCIAPPICEANRSSGAKSASVLLQEGLYAEQSLAHLAAAEEKVEVDILHYNATLVPDFEANSMQTKVTCTLRNNGKIPVDKLDLDILALEKRQGVKAEISEVIREFESGRSGQKFAHQCLERPKSEEEQGTSKYPRITRVFLSPPLHADEVTMLTFRYAWQTIDPKKRGGYCLFATLKNGEKEVCLLGDYAWLPRIIYMRYDELRELHRKQWWPKVHKPTWEVNMLIPKDYEAVALDGRFAGVEEKDDRVISKWKSNVPGEPQIMISRFDRIVSRHPDINVVLYVPKGDYNKEAVQQFGGFLASTCSFYCDLFGRLEGNEIHIGVSSAGQGGHGAYLGMTLDYDPSFLREVKKNEFWGTAAHELAHSWWGMSVTSYGRGTKFLRESLVNYAKWRLLKERYEADPFQEELAERFWLAQHPFFKKVMHEPLFYSDRDSGDMYEKGPLILNVLQREMGESDFDKMLKTFAQRFKNRHATFRDFVAVCNETTEKDWSGFIDQWFYGEGCPDYQLVDMKCSQTEDDKWKTIVTIRNIGQMTILCPLELRMSGAAQRESFRVPEATTQSLVFYTPRKVVEVEIDPDHNTYQGSAKDRIKKMLAVKSDKSWFCHWRGVAYAEIAEYEKAVQEISRAIASKREPAYLYSRGMTYLKMGNEELATKDLKAFIDRMLQDPDMMPMLAVEAILPGGITKDHRPQFAKLLGILTGRDFHFSTEYSEEDWDETLAEWRKWWKANKTDMKLSPKARALSFPGLK